MVRFKSVLFCFDVDQASVANYFRNFVCHNYLLHGGFTRSTIQIFLIFRHRNIDCVGVGWSRNGHRINIQRDGKLNLLSSAFCFYQSPSKLINFSFCFNQNGSAVGPAVVAPFLGLAVYGFDFARDIPWFIYGIMKLSFMRCGVIATALALFGFGRKTFECNAMYCHFKKPDLILHFLNVESVSIWNEIFTLCVLFVFFRLLNYFALRSRLVVK